MTSIKAVLEGGPCDLPEQLRVGEVADLAEKVKLPFYGGYEHFVFGGDARIVDGKPVAVYRWAGRTKVAE